MTEIETVWLPWPDRLVTMRHPLRDAEGLQLQVGDRVSLQHIARPEWTMSGIVVSMRGPGRAVEVKPSDVITSPANWVIA